MKPIKPLREPPRFKDSDEIWHVANNIQGELKRFLKLATPAMVRKTDATLARIQEGIDSLYVIARELQ